ncbi:MAG: trypsin-like peptidase domain-containing protein [Candidatus Omnitrophica bacterium]|nr:trypsin-like peptidase domain-containing protein [Candidatus Omnitrophota bacterium]
MLKKNIYASLLVVFAVCFLPGFVFAQSPRDAVVKVFVTVNKIDYYRPWQSHGSAFSSGSGCVIEGNHILTNAHVVSDSTFIQVRKESNPKKYTAKIKAISYECDLALLEVEDSEFFEGIVPLEMGDLPNLRDSVIVLGFPRGGDKLSITEGVVSRVEITPYMQSAMKLLAIQIDAAINPGNSGGPVLMDGKLVGIAMQIISNSQNIGYTIPTTVINHFVDDLKDGNYDGFPSLGIMFHNTENKKLREHYKITEKDGGVLISNILPFSAAENKLQEGDVIFEIEGIPIGVDGTFEFRKSERLLLSYLIHSKQVGETIKLTVSRNGKPKEIGVPLSQFVGLVPPPNHYEKPSYYIYGGVIFTVLSSDLLQSWGKIWWEKAPLNFMNYLVGNDRLNEDKKQEIVVLLNVLPDDVNVGYHAYSDKVIKTINGKAFDSFKEFVRIIHENKKDVMIFETAQGMKLILDAENIDAINTDILSRNNIPSQYSDDVAKWLTQ